MLGSSIGSSLRANVTGGIATKSAWVMSSASVLLVGTLIGVAGVCGPNSHWCWWHVSYLFPPGLTSATCQSLEDACDKTLTTFHM